MSPGTFQLQSEASRGDIAKKLEHEPLVPQEKNRDSEGSWKPSEDSVLGVRGPLTLSNGIDRLYMGTKNRSNKEARD